ncbi:Crp/Fnr family transcriptional regulator [Arabiibacter massiliensis]|uniref:Crp/Fnr family transcriptional regulator n=1 Tax=Arabiibacter massiliensis TaxID=1870985 RepID=UPI00155AB277|nr:Crp/Fnr family transcriptional regulator [Arabiibacter massiliensis]
MFWPDRGEISSELPGRDELVGMLQKAGVDYYERHVPKGVLFGWGEEPHRTAHFVAEGMVEIYKLERDGRKKTLYFCKKGDFFGFQILSDTCVPIATASACVDSDLVAIPKESFFKALHTCPDFADMIVKYLYNLISTLTNESVSSAFYASAQRVPMLLLSLGRDELGSRAAGGSDDVTAPIIVKYGNGDIANILGISRNSVTSSISRLQEQGIVAKRRNSIEILDMDRLESVTKLESGD